MKKVLFGLFLLVSMTSLNGCYNNSAESDEFYNESYGETDEPIDSIPKDQYPIPPNGKMFVETKK